MKDDYIDDSEMVRNTQHFVSTAPNYVSLSPVVSTLIDEQNVLLSQMTGITSGADDSRADLTTTVKGKNSLEDKVRARVLREFETLYPRRNDPGFELTRFFTTGHKYDIGKSAADLQKSLQKVVDGYNYYKKQGTALISEDDLATLTTMLNDFISQLNAVSSADSSKRGGTRELEGLRADWDRKYRGAQLIMHGLLLRVNRESEWKGLFLDYNAQGSSATTTQTGGSAEKTTTQGGGAVG